MKGLLTWVAAGALALAPLASAQPWTTPGSRPKAGNQVVQQGHGAAGQLPFYVAPNLVAPRVIAPSDLPSNTKVRDFGTTFGDTGGSALSSGSVVYFTVPYTCTIGAWNITVDAGTVTFDIWKIGTGSAIPTVTNTITASAKPALASGTALHSTSMSGWTTSVSANDIFGIQLNTVATAKYAEIDLECDQ